MHCTISIMGTRTFTQWLQCRMVLWIMSWPFWRLLDFLLVSFQEMHSDADIGRLNCKYNDCWWCLAMGFNWVPHSVFVLTTKYLQLKVTELFTHFFFSDLNCLTVSFTDTKPKSNLVSPFTSTIFYWHCMLCVNSSSWLRSTNLSKDYTFVYYISRNQRFEPVKLKSGPLKEHLLLFALTMTHTGLSKMFKGKIM